MTLKVAEKLDLSMLGKPIQIEVYDKETDTLIVAAGGVLERWLFVLAGVGSESDRRAVTTMAIVLSNEIPGQSSVSYHPDSQTAVISYLDEE